MNKRMNKKTKEKREKMRNNKILAILAIMIASQCSADSVKDADLDGVPDSIDQCPHTPFLHEVNSRGCTTKVLTLPEDSSNTNLTLSLGYGYFTNEDLIGRETQYISKAQLSYYHDNYSYTLKTSYYTYHGDKGIQDTVLKIKKRFSLNTNTKFKLGVGIKLPTYDFQGNQTDYTLYSSLTHYLSSKHSFFTGASYTFVKDKPIKTPLQNSYNIYMGDGYFFSTRFYASLSYNLSQSKFTTEHHIHTLSSTLYYKINDKFYTTLSYQREIGDEDLHDGLQFKIGMKLW